MKLKPYDVVVNGYETTLLLSDEDARKSGLLASDPAPAPKKAAEPPKKATRAPNKARRAPNKQS